MRLDGGEVDPLEVAEVLRDDQIASARGGYGGDEKVRERGGLSFTVQPSLRRNSEFCGLAGQGENRQGGHEALEPVAQGGPPSRVSFEFNPERYLIEVNLRRDLGVSSASPLPGPAP